MAVQPLPELAKPPLCGGRVCGAAEITATPAIRAHLPQPLPCIDELSRLMLQHRNSSGASLKARLTSIPGSSSAHGAC